MSAVPVGKTAIERATEDARVVGLGDLFQPRPAPAAQAAASAAQAPPQPDPREQLERERRQVLEAAHKQGLDAGMRDAEKQIETRAAAAEKDAAVRHEREIARLAEATRRLDDLVKALPGALAEIEQRIESITVEATLAATTRLLARAVEDEALVLDYCREALTEYAVRPATLRVHPGALADVKAALAEEDVRIEGDARLKPGQCRIESAKGLYDISLEHRLEALKQALLDSVSVASGRTEARRA